MEIVFFNVDLIFHPQGTRMQYCTLFSVRRSYRSCDFIISSGNDELDARDERFSSEQYLILGRIDHYMVLQRIGNFIGNVPISMDDPAKVYDVCQSGSRVV